MADLVGQIERITYYNEENGYSILKVLVEGRKDVVACVGTISSPTIGSILHASGQFIKHAKFGYQFKIDNYKISAPSNIRGIEKYLSSGLIRGIGPVMAKRIIQCFGERTLDIIEQNPDLLQKIEGIGNHRIDCIKKAWIEQKEIRTIIMFLQQYGISSTYAEKIYKKFGIEAISIVKTNPYKLASITGIGFKIADTIAQKLGFSESSIFRIQSGILYSLNESLSNGDIFVSINALHKNLLTLLSLDENTLNNAIETAFIELEKANKIIRADLTVNMQSVHAIFLTNYYIAEQQCANLLKELRDAERDITFDRQEEIISDVQKTLSIKLAEKQYDAVKMSMNSKLLIITGGPGTGKTTITKAILEIYNQKTKKILLAAPTGRAAKKMSEATNKSAKTIHRILEYSVSDREFKKNSLNPLNCDVFILDEASMIDIMLMYSLLKAIPQNAVIIIIGDTNQLPSVGPGAVLSDIINSNSFDVIELNEIFRQAKTSEITLNAHRIISNQFPIISNAKTSDFYFIEEDNPDKALDKLLFVVKERIPKSFGFNPINDVQVLTPMNKGNMGAIKINELLQGILNNNETEIVRDFKKYKINDKVMQIRNNYDKDVYNGDIGTIEAIDAENQELFINFDHHIIPYEFSELSEVVLAYAISIHKSQGSEYPVVVIPIMMSDYIMLQKNLLYTAITRGKKLVIIIGSKKAMMLAIKNNKVQERNTYLKYRLL